MLAAGLAVAAPVPPQTSPETVADEFLRGFESMAWAATAQRIHPDALDVFRETVTMLVQTDAAGDIPERLLEGLGADEYGGLGRREVFARVMRSLMGEAPGLMNALVTRRHEVVGSVAEGPDRAHVVYRVHPMGVSGAEPEVKVMTLGLAGERWAVLRSDELDVVRAALRGLPVSRPPPPPAVARPDTTGS